MRRFLLESLERRDLMASVPVALNDPLYTTPVSTDLVISSAGSGVSANDFEVDSTALSASVVVNPSHGSLVSFNSDGTFTYRPNTGYSGSDTFTYKVSNGSFDSNVATVSIQVGQVFGPRTNLDDNPLSAPNFTGANTLTQPLTLGQQLIYNSNTEPRPVVAVETSLRSAASVPDSIEAQLTFGGVVGSVVSYNTTGLSAGDPLRFVLQADGSSLATGYYDYTMTLTAKYTGSTDVVQTFTGSQAVVNRSASEFGRGWWLDGLDRLVTSTAGALLVKGNGDTLWYKKNGTTWDKAAGDLSFSTLTQSGSSYVLTSKSGVVLNFNSSGYLTSIVDANSNTATFGYNGSNQLTTITDPFSRSFSLTYTSGNVTSISDYASRSSTLAYSSGKLTSVTLPDPDGAGSLAAPVYAYGYDATTNLLNSYTDPRSNATSYSYNSTSRRLSQITHADSTTWTLVPVQTYGLTAGSGNTLVSPASVEGKVTDERSNEWKFLFDRFGNVVSKTTPVASTTVILRDHNGLPIKVTEADPDWNGLQTSPITRLGYNSYGDLLKQINPDLTTLTYTYNTSHHRPLTATDEVGRVTTMTYDTYGNALTRQDNAGNTWTYTYTSRGLVASETSPDPDGGGPLSAYVTGYSYDTSGRLTTKTLPNTSTLTYTYTTSNQVATQTNELTYTTTFAYDALDRLTSITTPDPDGAGALAASSVSYEYNALGLLAKETDPLGNETTHTYNNRNWRTVTTHPDPDGASSLAAPTETWTYDGTGNVTSYVDSVKSPLAPAAYEYDAMGAVVSSDGAASAPETREYDGLGRPTLISADGLDERFEYDARGRLLVYTRSNTVNLITTAYATTYTYNQAGQKTSVTDANGHTTTWDYTQAGWLNSEIKPDPDGSGANFGPTTTYGYDALGRVTAITDANGSISNFEYNFRGQLIQLTQPDPDGVGSLTSPITTRAYNAAGWLTSITDPLSRVTSYTYDNVGRRLTETLPDPDGAGSLTAPVTTTAYNASNWVTSVTDARGGVTSYTYDNLGRTATVTEPDPDGGGSLTSAVTTYTYGSRGLASITDALSHTTSFGYDADGNRTTVTDANSKTTTTVYDSQGRVTSVTTPEPDNSGTVPASTIGYIYDAFGRLARKTDSVGTTFYTYDGIDNLISLEDPSYNTTNWSYDALDRVTIETNELNEARSYVYDAMNNLTRKADRNGRVTQYEYDQLNRLTGEKWMSGTSQTPSMSIATTQEGGSGNETQTVGYSDQYGGFSGTFTLTFAGYTTSAINYDATAATVQSELEGLASIGAGNVTVAKTTDSYGEAVWTIAFKGALAASDRVQLMIDCSGMSSMVGITEIETTQAEGYAARDEIQTVTVGNATGGTFRLAYRGQTTVPLAYNASASAVDSALEALSTIGSGTVSIALVSGVYSVTFGGGSLDNTNVYSLQGDVSTATYGTVDRTISTTYDAASQVTQESDPAVMIDYTRDNLGRATSIVNTIAGLTPTVTFDQTFSAGSDRTQLKAKIGLTNDFKTDYSYDTLGRMTDIVQQGNSGNTVASKHVTLAYNKLGQFSAFNRYESTGTSSQVASTDYAYDTLNRLTDIDHKQGSTVLASYDYSYDFVSRITSVTSSQDGVSSYSYDMVSQLTAADHTGQTDESYSFDSNGSRTGGGYTVSTNNLITSDGTYNYAYDDEGNRTTKTKIADSSYTTYTWDYRNRLTAVKDYNSFNVLLKETTYAYDTHNRLIKSTCDADGAGSGTATARYWAFDEGINPLLEFDGSSASDVSHRYLWGPAVDQLFADEQPTSTGSAGNVLWALGDNLGTIRDIADLSGSTTSVTNHRRFGAYGNLVSESNSAVDMVFDFNGKLYDENTNLQNNLNRWYDAAIGQWISEDPIGFDAGDENLRRYVSNNSLSQVDPRGLQRFHFQVTAPTSDRPPIKSSRSGWDDPPLSQSGPSGIFIEPIGPVSTPPGIYIEPIEPETVPGQRPGIGEPQSPYPQSPYPQSPYPQSPYPQSPYPHPQIIIINPTYPTPIIIIINPPVTSPAPGTIPPPLGSTQPLTPSGQPPVMVPIPRGGSVPEHPPVVSGPPHVSPPPISPLDSPVVTSPPYVTPPPQRRPSLPDNPRYPRGGWHR